jgi:probable HAF family extracellular repeat protein/autotransporter-associated beta strand protein
LGFEDNSTAGNAIITNYGSMGFGGVTTAGTATIINQGDLEFGISSTAGSSTIITNNGGVTDFHQMSDGGQARFITNAGGKVDFSDCFGPQHDNKITAGSFEGGGNYFLGSNQLIVGGNNLSTTVSGVISDGGENGGVGGSLVKVGTGTLTLASTNTYTGTTDVNSGLLIVNGSIASSSEVTVNVGAALGGTGVVAGTTVNGGGTLESGASVGTLTVSGNLVLNSGADYLVQLSSSAASETIVTGTASITGTLTVDTISGSYSGTHTYTVLHSTGLLSGAFSSLAPVGNSGVSYSLSYDAHDAFLTVTVPPVMSISATTDNGSADLNSDHVVTISLSLNEPFFVTGNPFLLLNDNEVATYTAGSGSDNLKFTYTVQPGDNVADLQVTGLNLNGGTIEDTTGIPLSGGGLYNYSIISPPSEGFIEFANGINNADQVVGYYYDNGGLAHGFLFSNGSNATLDYPSSIGTQTYPEAINANGQIVGWYSDGSSDHAFVYNDGSYSTLRDLGTNTFAYGINASGQIVGYYQNAAAAGGLTNHGFLYNGQSYVTLDDPSAWIPTNTSGTDAGTVATAINGAGQIVGYYFDSSNSGYSHGFLYSNGSYLTIDDPLGTHGTRLTGINDAGQIVGWYNDGTATPSFVYSNGTFTTVGGVAQAINDLGQIAGNYSDTPHTQHGFIATPVPGNLALQIDTTIPVFTAVTASPSMGDLNAGKTVAITLATSEAVIVTGTPTAKLNDGGTATYDSIATIALNDPTKLVFDYTVGSSDTDVPSLQVTSLNLSSGARIEDGAGNNLNLSLSAVPTYSGPQIDTSTPTVSSIIANPSTGTVFTGQVITITVNFSEKVAVTGTPTLSLNDGGAATFQSGSGTNALVFSYTVLAGQYISNLAVTGFNLPNGATVKDRGGNIANPSGATVTFSGLQVSGSVADNWISSSSGNWTTIGDWSSGVPNSNSDAVISKTGNYTVTISTSADVGHSLAINDTGAIVSDNTGGSLRLAGGSGTLTITNGTFQLNGGNLQAGTISIGSGTFLVAKGTYTGSNVLSETITDNGSLTVNTSATISGNISGTGAILAQNSANLTITGNLTGSEIFTVANSAHVLISTAVSSTRSFVIANNGVLEFGASDSENVTFASGASGTLKLDHSLTAPFTGSISGLTPKDSIDVADLTYVKGHMSASYAGNTLGGTLTVSNGSQRVSLKLSGNYTNATWVLSKDSTGGTTVVDPLANTSPPSSTLDSLLGGDLPPSSGFGLTAQATTGMQTPASPPPDIPPASLR